MSRLASFFKNPRIPDFKFWINHWRAEFDRKRHEHFNMLSPIRERPLVLTSSVYPQKAEKYLHHPLKGEPILLYYFPGWTIEEGRGDDKLTLLRKLQSSYPEHRIVIVANNELEVEIAAQFELEAVFASKNLFINESVFDLLSMEKKFDAVIDSQVAPFKRLELGTKIESLALVTYSFPGHFSQSYMDEVLPLLNHAHWANGRFGTPEYRKLKAREVVEVYAQSRVGVILSAVEGGCKAAVQYMLCGLPVVSTRSIGGRDVFYDDDYVKVVPDDPVAVAQAVQAFAADPPDPKLVRERTLACIAEHRDRFVDHLLKTTAEMGHPIAPPSDPMTLIRAGETRYLNMKDLVRRVIPLRKNNE